MRKKKINTHKNNFIKLMVKLQNNLSCGVEIDKLRHDWNLDDINKLFNLSKKIGYEKNIHGHLFPNKFYCINSFGILSKISNENEVKWANYVLNLKKIELKEFINLKNRYEELFLKDNYEECDNILNEIKIKFGYSIWFIKNKIALIHFAEGLNEQKVFSASVIQSSVDHGIAAFITHYASLLAEEAVVVEDHVNTIKHFLAKIASDEALASYLKYQLLPFVEIKLEDISGILRYAYRSSLIDLFFAYLDIKSYNLFIECGFVETDEVEDATPWNDCQECCEYKKNVLKSYNNVLNNNIMELINDVNYLVNYSISNFVYIDILSRINEKLKVDIKSSYCNKIYDYIYSIKNDSDLCIKSYRKLLKTIMVNSYFYSSRYAFILGLDGDVPEVIIEFKHLLYRVADESLRCTPLHVEICSSISCCEIELECHSEVLQQYRRLVLGHFDEDAIKCVFENPQLLLPVVKSLVVQQQFDMLLNINMALKNHQIGTSLNLNRYLALSEIKSGNFFDAIETIVSNVVLNPSHIDRFPLELCKIAIANDKIADKKSINYPIFYALYDQCFNTNSVGLRKDTLEDFLEYNEINKPSEINNLIMQFDLNKLIYFLKYVCIEKYMDGLLCFRKSIDVLCERIEICKILIKLDKKNQNEYQSEITGILRRIRTKEQMTKIEKSKIYVDIERLVIIAERMIMQQFDRLKMLIDSPVGIEMAKLSSTAASMIADAKDSDSSSVLEIPKNEVYSLLADIIVKLTDLFVSNTEYGLDGYLSVRIRHGTLTGQLRAPLDAEKLITQLNIELNQYNENVYWKEQLGLPLAQWMILSSILNNLSRRLDEHIKSIISKKIQIKRSDKDSGMFDFSFNSISPLLLVESVRKAETATIFSKIVFTELLIPLLELSLKNIRESFKSDFKNRAIGIINQALMEINRTSFSQDVSALSRSLINAKTTTGNSYDRSMDWFTVSSSSSIELFLIQDVIDVGKQSIQTVDSGFDVITSISDELQDLQISSNFSAFVDVFVNIFQNISKHAGSDKEHIANINVFYNFDNLRVEIFNRVSESISSLECKNKIEIIRNNILSGDYLDFIKREHGTGLCKIYKIIKHDISHRGSLDFEFDEISRVFSVSIEVPIRFEQVNLS